MTKLDLVTGIILVENGEISEEDLIEFVREYQYTLVGLQGFWGRLVHQLREGGHI